MSLRKRYLEDGNISISPTLEQHSAMRRAARHVLRVVGSTESTLPEYKVDALIDYLANTTVYIPTAHTLKPAHMEALADSLDASFPSMAPKEQKIAETVADDLRTALEVGRFGAVLQDCLPEDFEFEPLPEDLRFDRFPNSDS